jgi:hypothetical protein
MLAAQSRADIADRICTVAGDVRAGGTRPAGLAAAVSWPSQKKAPAPSFGDAGQQRARAGGQELNALDNGNATSVALFRFSRRRRPVSEAQ